MFKKALIIIGIFLIIIFSFAAGGIFYIMQDLRYYSEQALKPLEDKTGLRINFEDVVWKLSVGLGVTVKNLKVTDIATNTLLLHSTTNYMRLQLFPLLRKNIVISKIVIDAPRIYICRNQSGNWSLPGSFINKLLTETDSSAWPLYSILLRHCLIHNGAITFDDRYLNTQLQFKNVNLDLSKQLFFGKHRFSFSAEQQGDVNTHISMTGTIATNTAEFLTDNVQVQSMLNLQNFNPAVYAPYYKQWFTSCDTEGFVDATLKCSLNPGRDFSVSGWIKSDALTLRNIFETPITINKILLKGDAVFRQGSLEVSNTEFSIPGVEIKGTLTAAGLPQSPAIEAHLSTNAIAWKTLKESLPESLLNKINPEICNKLTEGSFELKKLSLKTGISPAGVPVLELLDGQGALSNVKIVLKNTLPQLKLASGLFSITKDKLTLTNIAAQCFPNDAHIINGVVKQPFNAPVADVKVLSTCPADSVMTSVSSLYPEQAENIAKGISIGTGILKLESQIKYPSAAGKQAELLSAIDLSQLNYTVGHYFGKPFGLRNMLTVKTMITPGTVPSAVEWRYALNDDSLLLSGTWENIEGPVIKADYHLRDMNISLLELPFLPAELKMQGILSGNGAVVIPLSQSLSPDLRGDITAKGFEMHRTDDTVSLVSLNAQGTFNGDRLHVVNAAGSWGKTSMTCSGDFVYSTNPLGQFTADVEYLDLDDFIETVIKFKHMFGAKKESATATSIPSQGEKAFFRRVVINIPAHARKGKFMSWHFTDGKTNISIKDGVMTYGDIDMHAYQGIINGTVIHDFSQPDVFRLTFIPDAKGIEFEGFLPELKENNVIAGKIDLEGMYTSLFRRDFEIVPHMEGNFKIKMQDAKLGKFTIISKIFSLLNFTEMIKLKMPDMLSKGMPIDTITGTFAMKSGIAHTEDLFLKSPAMNLSAVGDIIFPKKEIDLIIGVQPLETIGKILGSIPIAGKILTGENKTITVSYFQVSGPYKDASVKPIPVESLSRGVITIFKRLYNLPQEIFKPGQSKEKNTAH